MPFAQAALELPQKRAHFSSSQFAPVALRGSPNGGAAWQLRF